MKKLLQKQRELMDQVPHNVRPIIHAKMIVGINLISEVMQYLNSCGHKPWRPNPLSKSVQQKHLAEITRLVKQFYTLDDIPDHGLDLPPETFSRQVVSGLGVIEEAIEYLVSIQEEKEKPEQLEELADILFFHLELVILGGFTWAEIEREYYRKHKVNLDRYRRAKSGDYQWDLRGKKEGL